jgi:hypothetical protein
LARFSYEYSTGGVNSARSEMKVTVALIGAPQPSQLKFTDCPGWILPRSVSATKKRILTLAAGSRLATTPPAGTQSPTT